MGCKEDFFFFHQKTHKCSTKLKTNRHIETHQNLIHQGLAMNTPVMVCPTFTPSNDVSVNRTILLLRVQEII